MATAKPEIINPGRPEAHRALTFTSGHSLGAEQIRVIRIALAIEIQSLRRNLHVER